MTELQKPNRAHILWADALRSLACIMVTIIHVSGVDWYDLPTTGEAWLTANAFDSLVRPAVVLFFMLSGSFLLRRDPEPKKLLFRALRLAGLWLIMDLFYVFVYNGFGILKDIGWFLDAVMRERYHLWFLRTMACLYLLVPVLRALVVYQDGKWVKWFLGVFFIFGILRYTLGQLPFDGEPWNNFRLLFVPELCQYSGYFVLGWYLTEKTAPAIGKKRLVYGLLYLLVTVGIAVGTYLCSVGAEHNDERFYSYMGFPVLVMGICLFQRARGWRETGLVQLLAKFAPLTLGVYVFHPVMIDVAIHFGVSKEWPRILFIPVTVTVIVAASAVVTWLLRRIPFVRKIL